MSAQTINMEWMNWPQTKTLVEAFVRGNIAFKFVGGCVRDALLGLNVVDIDIATSSLPETVMAHLASCGVRVVPTGIAHGTVSALIEDKKYEITTLRKDLSTDGRHAVVAFTDDWLEDAKRRDFTMNALYADAQGKLTDYWGGLEDARAGIVRFIGEAHERITEDALRILRFFRFSARYAKGELDASSLAACEKKRALVDGLSGERIQTEMFKLLIAPRAMDMLDVMQSCSILAHMIPAPVSTAQLQNLRQLESYFNAAPDAILSLALLLRSVENSDTALSFITSRWKLSGTHKKTLQQLLTPLALSLNEAEAKAQLRRMGAELFICHLLLSGTEGNTPASKLEPLIHLARSWIAPVFPISGDDLLAKGFTSGAALGEALTKLEDLWEKSDYSASKEELLGFSPLP